MGGDYARDAGGMEVNTAFITGSRVYGESTPESDIDLVILCDTETRDLLWRETEGESNPHHKEVMQIRFGKLNIIACWTDEQFAAWKLGTERLKQDKEASGEPIDRATAKRVFRFLRNFNVESILDAPELVDPRFSRMDTRAI